MRYKLLGRSGVRVSELALGTMTFGEDWGWGADSRTCRAMFDAYAEAGGNFIDTANNYTDGSSETIVGDLIAADRDHFVLATKFTLSMRPDDPNAGGNARKNMRQSVEASLRRLQTEVIDLLWLHMWDFTVPVEEVVRGMNDLVRGGKVVHIGISDTPAWIVSRANTLAELRGWDGFVALQVPYSLARRDVERELLPMARALDLTVTPWGVLAGGVLTGKYNGKPAGPARYKPEDVQADRLQLARTVMEVAGEAGCSPAQVALNWVRQQQERAVSVPIIGARTLEQLSDALGALDHLLSPAQLARLDEVSAIPPGFPNDFLTAERVQELIFGNTFPGMDHHRRGGPGSA